VRRFGPGSDRLIRFGAILALIFGLGCAGLARAENASPFLDLDADACAKLDDKNLQVGPPAKKSCKLALH
jgi:hypothetical protein